MSKEEKLRLAGMTRFGFGPEAMKQTKVCRVCRKTCRAKESLCGFCGAVLPRETLFELYKSYHLYCPDCDTVVSSDVFFCPTCGRVLRQPDLAEPEKAE
ncbi:MAG: hypothetical protein Q4B50_06535 [Bacillota bacterium]|nr:hypothetical protein [Bacillota bacterium]